MGGQFFMSPDNYGDRAVEDDPKPSSDHLKQHAEKQSLANAGNGAGLERVIVKHALASENLSVGVQE